jgi:Tol biopolymer transport system component
MARLIALVLALAVAGPGERRLATIPDGVRLAHRPSFDAEGRTVVWSAVIDDQMWLYKGGERQAGPFDCVCSPSVSARGGRVAFAGIREGRRYAFVDGLEGTPYDYVTIPVVVSAEGSAVAFAATLGKKSFVVRDGRPGPAFDEVRAPVLSADGKRCAYAAQRAGAWTVVVDDRPGAFVDFVDDPVFSADGRTVAYSTGFRIVVGDAGRGPYDAVTAPALSDDGRVLAFGRRSAGRWTIVCGDREQAVEGDLERVFVSGDGTRAGGVILRGRKYGVIVDGRVTGSFDQLDLPRFSPDGRRWAVAARSAAIWCVATGEREWGPYGDVGSPVFSADSRGLSFGARVGRELSWVSIPLP